MPTLAEISSTAPDLVDRTRRLLASCPNAVLGTYRRDGSIRLSGIDPMLVSGEIIFGSMPRARKLDDLRRDPRMSLHTVPWESRRTVDGQPLIEADAKLDGRAVEAVGRRREKLVAAIIEEKGFDPGDEATFFIVDVGLLSSFIVDQEANPPELEISTWRTERGLTVTRRH